MGEGMSRSLPGDRNRELEEGKGEEMSGVAWDYLPDIAKAQLIKFYPLLEAKDDDQA